MKKVKKWLCSFYMKKSCKCVCATFWIVLRSWWCAPDMQTCCSLVIIWLSAWVLSCSVEILEYSYLKVCKWRLHIWRYVKDHLRILFLEKLKYIALVFFKSYPVLSLFLILLILIFIIFLIFLARLSRNKRKFYSSSWHYHSFCFSWWKLQRKSYTDMKGWFCYCIWALSEGLYKKNNHLYMVRNKLNCHSLQITWLYIYKTTTKDY